MKISRDIGSTFDKIQHPFIILLCKLGNKGNFLHLAYIISLNFKRKYHFNMAPIIPSFYSKGQLIL